MTLSEADLLFATPERIKPLNELLKLPSTKRIRLKGLAGSAPAVVFALPGKAICIRPFRRRMVSVTM